MSVSRRRFIHNALAAGSMFPLFSMNYSRGKIELKIKNKDEDYWRKVAGMYHQNVKFINLESGYFSPSPESVKDYWVNFVNEINDEKEGPDTTNYYYYKYSITVFLRFIFQIFKL